MLKHVLSLLFAPYILSAQTLVHRPESIVTSGAPEQRAVPGVIYNLDNFIHLAEYFGLQLDAYGANSTVDYFVPVFPDQITTFANNLPQIVMNQNDVILIEVTVPDTDWLNTHSLFNVTPYFYFYEADGVDTPVYASENITIQFFELFDTPGNTIQICITPNATLANEYQTRGYMISSMPEEYLDATTFQILFRVGTISAENQLSINNFVKVTFLKATNAAAFTGSDYYDAAQVIASFPTELLPASTPQYLTNISDYNAIVTYLGGEGYTTYQCLKYLSNVYNTSYAFNNFYKAITVNPAAQMQANNTGENYYNSQGIPVYSNAFIDLRTIVNSTFLYVLSLNQNTMGSGLTSNVQTYNAQDLTLIPDGLIITSPDLPPFSAPDYPYVSENPYALFQINAYNISDLIESGITEVILTERISYNPVNFYQSSNEYEGKAYFFFGDALTPTETTYLETNYDIAINY